MVSDNICTICLENFHTEYGRCVATVPLFSETSYKEFSNVLCEQPVILVELFLKLRIVFIQGSEDGKRSVCKKCARKIVNCCRMFTELLETLAGGRALDEAKESTPRTPSIPVLEAQFLFEASDPQLEWRQRRSGKKKHL